MISRKILITNDDGINANGLMRLAECAAKFGEVWVVAPDSQRSAMSHSITLRHSIEAWKVDFPVPGVKAYACSGTPADCVRIGVRNIVPGKPDVIFSGINYGYNMASDLQYSATAGAAFEGAFQKIPSIAFSENFDDDHSVTDKYLEEIMGELIDKNPGRNRIWNVNFPGCNVSECKGILYDRKVSCHDFYDDSYTEEKLENGVVSYMVAGERQQEAEEGSDLRAIYDNYVSVGLARNVGEI